jgi:SAM-dependent methyltransferase
MSVHLRDACRARLDCVALSENTDERGVSPRLIAWNAKHGDDWIRSIREGDRVRARALYEGLGHVLRHEIREEGGRPVLSDPKMNTRIRARLDELGVTEGRALDLGCGPTPVAGIALRNLGLDVVGLDVAHSICQLAQETSEGLVRVIVADAEHLPFADGVFDLVTCDDTIEHVFDQRAAAAEVARVTRSGARLLIVTPNASGLHVLAARAHDLSRGRRRARAEYHITHSHVKELRWDELLRVFRPWFKLSWADAVGFEGNGRRARLFDRIARLPGGWRLGWTLFVELERVPDADAPVVDGSARGHYAQLDEPDSQTSPGVIRGNLKAWLDDVKVDGPVLDLGTGVGSNLSEIGSRHVAFGVDVSVAPLRAAKTIAPVVACDGARLPFRDATFGAVVCTEVLEHVDDPAAVIGEAARVLAPGGVMYITTPNYANTAGLHKLLADKRSGRHDWNPWGAHEGGYEAFTTGRKIWSAARRWFDLERVRGLDFGQAITGRFALTDRLAWSRGGQAVIKRLLPRIEGASGMLGWMGMHTELVLRKRD